MAWISENWLLILLFGGMAAMHLFGHGHGGHKHDKTAKRKNPDEDAPDSASDTKTRSEDA